MNAPDYDALEAVVAAATPGPWECAGSEVLDPTGDLISHPTSRVDATHIATFDPSMVADLLARARERDNAIAERDRLRDGLEAILVAEPDVETNPDIPALYWRRTGSTSTHLSKNSNASLCVACSETCSRATACACCWPPVEQADLRTLLDQTANDGSAT